VIPAVDPSLSFCFEFGAKGQRGEKCRWLGEQEEREVCNVGVSVSRRREKSVI
jgi:hypothetical protein